MALDLWKNIKNKKFSPIYLLYGPEKFLIEKTEKLICEEAILPEEAVFNLAVFDMEETLVELAIEEMETAPFLGERKVVILQNAYFLTAEKTKEKIEHDLDRLIAYIANPAEFTIAIIAIPNAKPDERKKVCKLLKKEAAVLEAKPLQQYELVNWVKDFANQYQIKVSSTTIDGLINQTGNHLTNLSTEMEKLSLFLKPGEELTVEMIELLVSKSLEQNVFDLVDLIVKKRKAEAVALYHQLLIQKEEPIRILAAIARQYRILLQVKILQAQGYTTSEMANKLKLNPYPVKLAMQQINAFSEKYLLKILHELAEIDFQMKTGVAEKELLLDLFILRV